MTVIPITCDNCGAKYKLPETFKGNQAKCQKCGSVIDVAKQRDAAEAGGDAKPAAAAKPAAKARPAVDRSKARAGAAGSTRKATADKPARPSRSRGRTAATDEGEERPRRGRAEKKKDNTPMILGAVGLVLLLAVGGYFAFAGGDEPKADEQVNTNNAGAPANAPKADDADGPKEPADEAAAPAAPTSEGGADAKLDALVAMIKEQVAKVAPEAPPIPDAQLRTMLQQQLKSQGVDLAQLPEGSMQSIADGLSAILQGMVPGGADAQAKPADAPAADAVPMPDGPKEPWMKQRNPAQTMADVKSAAELYGDVQWPESIDAAKKAEIMGIAEDLDVNGGIRHIRAKRKLVEAGYAGLFGVLERLHGLDYRSADDAAFGFELNKMIEEVTGGLNARYAAVQAGEDIHPAKAQWNTKNVKAWMSTFAKWPDEAAFTAAKKARAKNAK